MAVVAVLLEVMVLCSVRGDMAYALWSEMVLMVVEFWCSRAEGEVVTLW